MVVIWLTRNGKFCDVTIRKTLYESASCNIWSSKGKYVDRWNSITGRLGYALCIDTLNYKLVREARGLDLSFGDKGGKDVDDMLDFVVAGEKGGLFFCEDIRLN